VYPNSSSNNVEIVATISDTLSFFLSFFLSFVRTYILYGVINPIIIMRNDHCSIQINYSA